MDKKKIGLMALLIFFLTINIAIAQNTRNVCLSDNITLQMNNSYNIYNGTAWNWLNITENVNCDYGCDNVTLSCKPATYLQDLTNFGIVIGIMAFFIAIYMFAKRRR